MYSPKKYPPKYALKNSLKIVESLIWDEVVKSGGLVWDEREACEVKN